MIIHSAVRFSKVATSHKKGTKIFFPESVKTQKRQAQKRPAQQTTAVQSTAGCARTS